MTPLIRPASADELIDLRHRVLRAGLERETAMFPGDDDPATRHFAALLDARIVGCVTLHRNEWNGAAAWQLRGMAIDSAHQRSGIGAALLRAVEAFVRESDVKQLWCNARTPAAAFSEKHGWTIASEPFDIPTAGPHVKMTKRL